MGKRLLCLCLFSVLLSACTTPPPRSTDNICEIFKQYPQWYWAAQKTQRRWGVPVNVQMAIMHQESRFRATAKPPRTKLLWVIPWARPSTSYGFTQALDITWERYQREAGRRFASRDNFADAADFIGWYADSAHRRAGIASNDAYRLYLAYHEGVGGYQKRTYLRKPWLIKVAQKVKARGQHFQGQLRRCQGQLPRKPWYRVW